MEFNYLSLPRGDLARKRPTAGARGRTGQEGGGKRKGEALISSSGKKLDHLRFDLERCHSEREGRGVRDFGKEEKKQEVDRETENDMHMEFSARHT